MTARPAAAAAALALVASLALALVAACTGGDDGRSVTRLPEPKASPGEPVDEPLLIALALAKNHHHKADVLLREGRVDDAVAEVRKVLTIRYPAGAPEGEDVQLDARASLAKLLVLAGDVDQALQVVEEGIAGARRESFFLANLYTVRGEVHEAAAARLDGADPAAARERRRLAIDSYDQAIAINKRLQDKLVEEAAP